MIPGSANPLLLASAAAAGAYNIERSVRFNSADSAYLSRTPSSAGNRRTWTWSGWVKRSKLSATMRLLRAVSGGTEAGIQLLSGDTIELYHYSGGYTWQLVTSQLFRDVSAWYHIVVAFDTTQGTAADRVSLYVNGAKVTAFSTSSYPSQNFDGLINTTNAHAIAGSDLFFDGYLANIHFIDGQALDPTSFGFTDSNGVWQPKAYTGSYGTNGYNLDFADTSSATALGNDVSGNNNDFTPSGLVAGPAYTANSFSTEFDGTGDYLSIPDSTDFDLGSGDFTIEAWVYPDSGFTLGSIITKRNSPAIFAPFLLRNSSTTSLTLLMSTSGTSWDFTQTAASALTTAAWQHVAVTRSGTAIKAFVNGTEVISSTLSGALTTNTQPVVIGSDVTANHWDGKISNLRIIKGRALYTAAFTPPSTALTAVTDTVLLTCQDSTFIDNSPSAHTITAVNDAATTTVSPFEPVDGSDAMLDSPTNYGSGDLVRGNYATWNPLNSAMTLTNGNLEANTTTQTKCLATFGMETGKWYCEVTQNATGNNSGLIGLTKQNVSLTTYTGADSTSYGYFAANGNKYNNGSASSYGASYTTNDVIGIAFDADNGTLVFYKNGVSQGTAFTGLTSGPYFFSVSNSTTTGNQSATSANFGQQPFKYPAPAGYKSLCSTNLPTPAIADGSTAMDVVLYTGNNSTQSISGLKFSPDLAWFKGRSGTYWHAVVDSVRGRSSGLSTNSTNAEYTSSAANDLVSFDSTGFTLGPVSNWSSINRNGESLVAWTWDAGSSTVSNTDGTITSQVRANPTAGCSVVSYTGTGANATVGHGLNAVPEMIIVKNRDAALNWNAYHVGVDSSSPEDYFLRLNFTDAIIASVKRWNNTAPTSSVFSVGTSGNVNGNTQDLIAYCFAPVEGFSSFGSFTGSTSNTFVYTGMRPRWLMIKRTDTTGNWQILDTEREGYNVDNDPLWANLADQEGTTDIADILSNGFKMRDGATGDYIYAAFAEHPFNTSRAR